MSVKVYLLLGGVRELKGNQRKAFSVLTFPIAI